jgi:hypothetical protein
MKPRYQIADDPSPSAISHLAVSPMWPVFALMLGGAGFAWLWLALNSQAIGSATRREELVWLSLTFLASSALLGLGLAAVGAGQLPDGAVPYLLIALNAVKLVGVYRVFALQLRSWAVREAFYGSGRSGWPGLALAFLARGLLSMLPDSWAFWRLVLG